MATDVQNTSRSSSNLPAHHVELLQEEDWQIGNQRLRSRLILGTGKYDSFEIMAATIAASGTQVVTVAIRRERLHDSRGRNILDHLDLNQLVLLPNTSGCYDADTAVRCARMGREILLGLENPGSQWVKLEVLGDSRSLLPDVVETLKATEVLVKDGFDVLCYSNDDPVTAKKLKNAGATSVMPAASPIGSGLGVVNPYNLQIILEELKQGDAAYPIIVDAGIGTVSDAVLALELGADAVLLNTAIARAQNPVLMARGMNYGVQGGRLAHLGGRIAKSKYAAASSPEYGIISERNVD